MKQFFATFLEHFIAWVIIKSMETPYFNLVNKDGTPYMDRYWIVPDTRTGAKAEPGTGPVAFRKRPFAWLTQKLGITVRIHNIRSSDDDRAPHDHPFHYLTIVLRGGYWEKVPKYDKAGHYLGIDRKWHGPGSILFKRATSWHILELPDGESAWTLFITGKKVQKWGFMVDLFTKRKVSYNDYLGIPENKDKP